MSEDELLEKIIDIRSNTECMSEKPDYSWVHGCIVNGSFRPYRCYTSSILLYPDCDEHFNAIQLILNRKYNFGMIIHDKDKKIELIDDLLDDEFVKIENNIPIDDNKLSIKKKHVHVVTHHCNARTNTSIAKELGISSRFVLMFSSLPATLLYLIHRDYQDKYQYPASDVVGTLAYKLQSLCELYDRDDNEILLYLLKEINNTEKDRIIDITDFSISILERGFSPHVQQKYFYLLNNCINQHNKRAEYWIDRKKEKGDINK